MFPRPIVIVSEATGPKSGALLMVTGKKNGRDPKNKVGSAPCFHFL
jgi:hypothetical protein